MRALYYPFVFPKSQDGDEIVPKPVFDLVQNSHGYVFNEYVPTVHAAVLRTTQSRLV